MSLTSQQKATLKAHIDATPELSAFPNTNAGNMAIAGLLNEAASPAFIVWRTSVTWDEIMLNGVDWARVDNLSVGKARIWDWMFNNEARSFNPSKANIRAGIDATWVGTTADLAVRANVYTHCKRLANRIEKLFATGTGSNADPAILGFEGTVTMVDVEEARNS